MFIQHKFTSTLFIAWRTWNEQRKCEEMVSAVQWGKNYGAWQGLKSLVMGEMKESECKASWDKHFTLSELHVYFSSGKSLGNDQKTKDTMQNQLKGLAVTFFDKGITKLIPQHDKWLNLHGKWWSSSFIQVPTVAVLYRYQHAAINRLLKKFYKQSLHPISSYFLDMLHKSFISK